MRNKEKKKEIAACVVWENTLLRFPPETTTGILRSGRTRGRGEAAGR